MMDSPSCQSAMLLLTTRVQPPRCCKNNGLSKALPQISHFLRIPSELRLIIYRSLLVPCLPRFLDRKKRESLKLPEMMQMYPEILCVNRQIYSEASEIMYSEVILMLFPGDLVCLRPNSEDITTPSEHVWRHNPLDGLGVPGPYGTRIYRTPELDGKMEPHVFARFRQVNFELDFAFGLGDGCPSLFIDADLNIKPKDRVSFKKYLRRTKILRDFTRVISNAPKLTHLKITLEIRAMPAQNPDLHDDDDNLPELYFRTVDTRAVEMFIEFGILNSLRTLTNVEYAYILVLDPWEQGLLKLQSIHELMLRDLELDIENKDIRASTSISAVNSEEETENDESQEDDGDE